MSTLPNPAHQPTPNPGGASPTLFFVILGIIVTLLAAFLILHPGGSHGRRSDLHFPNREQPQITRTLLS